ncbi:GPN-loop GTPase [Entophlyctis helioformis]|nr:GPN-loop GTPase [Entophlyctis helioformis]
MGKVCQLVMGPAGSGKSTYCKTMVTHSQTIKRSFHLVNLDPAAENFEYKPTIDIRDLITLDDVMEELQFGPNGGLIYCMEHLMDNLDWMEDELQDYEDDYLIIDCPGQIELYTHFTIMQRLVEMLQRLNYRVCSVYLLDSQFIEDTPKFFAGVMSAMSAMLQIEVPHVNVLTKMDLLGERKPAELDRFFEVDSSLLLDDANKETRPKFHALNEALVRLIDEYNMVNFLPLNIKDEDSVANILEHIDHAVQYGEDMEPKEPKDEDFQEEGGYGEYDE